jgi:ABC-2 type transport system ATP-binding protein
MIKPIKENPQIRVQKLNKAYGKTVAINNISFNVYKGEIFGMVGPNGAGKTTTIECIEGLRNQDSGTITVMNLNTQEDGYTFRSHIGVQLQESSLPQRLKVWEAMDLYASFYDQTKDWNQLLKDFGLEEKRDTPFAKLSGGQKQRLFIAIALVHDPEVLFLDELTTGLDPQARRAMWELIRKIKNQGKTVLLTTHFMDEAQRLCDRVAILDKGQIIALDSPRNLIRSLGGDNRIVFTAGENFNPSILTSLPSVKKFETIGERVYVYGDGANLVKDLVNTLTTQGFNFKDFRTEQPTLEDVFLSLTGYQMKN